MKLTLTLEQALARLLVQAEKIAHEGQEKENGDYIVNLLTGGS